MRILNDPDRVLTNYDSTIYEKLMKNQLLIPEGVDEFEYILEQHRKAVHNDDFLRLIILPTLSCNLNCPYCYETQEGSKMGEDTIRNIKSLVEGKLSGLEKLKISWFGGEPLLYPDVIRDVGTFASKLAGEQGIRFVSTITTNATLLSEDVIKILEKAKVSELQATLDGSRATHNRTRIPPDGRATYSQIVTNIKNYLEYDSENSLILRVHLHSVDEREMDGIKKIFEQFGEYKDQLKIYFRQLFPSCTEGWDKDLVDEPTNPASSHNSDKKENRIIALYEEAIEENFRIYFGKTLSSCYADYDSSWVIKPDGLLHKCTVALEEERSLGKLTEDGLKYFWDRYTTWQKRTSDGFDRDEMKNCPFFPFSWGKCPYSKYQNPDQTSSCNEIKNSIRTKEKLLGIKSRYARNREEFGANK